MYPCPITLLRASELRGRYIQFGKNNLGDERITLAPLNSLQNGIKVRRKELDALNDEALLQEKSKAEQALRAVAGISGPDPWQEIAAASNARAATLSALHFHRKCGGLQQRAVSQRAAVAQGRR